MNEEQFEFEKEMELTDIEGEYRAAFDGKTINTKKTVYLTDLFSKYIAFEAKSDIKCLVKAKRGTLIITIIKEEKTEPTSIMLGEGEFTYYPTVEESKLNPMDFFPKSEDMKLVLISEETTNKSAIEEEEKET